MSVDKFGRSSASIARRPTPLLPSRAQLQSVGVLCKTGEYVDFKTAFARNLNSPELPTDAATKDYVDKCTLNVKAIAAQKVEDNLETVIKATHELTIDFLNKRLVSFNIAFKKLITEAVEENVKKRIEGVVLELIETFRNRVESINESFNKRIPNMVEEHVKKSMALHSEEVQTTIRQILLANSQKNANAKDVINPDKLIWIENSIADIRKRITTLERPGGRKQPRTKQ